MSILDQKKQRWSSLRALYEKKFSKRTDQFQWIFRGEKFRKEDSTTRSVSDLQSSLDKVFASFKPDKRDGSGKRYKRKDLEISILREFQRKAHPYLPRIPRKSNTIEWLTFIQHYGGPTRLMDWTYSFYVAVFFAIARLDCSNEFGEVWVANVKWLTKAEQSLSANEEIKKRKLSREKDAKNMDVYHNAILKELFNNREPLVILLNAFNLNDRLVTQQGTFLVQGDIEKSFGENIRAMGEDKQLQKNIHRIIIDLSVTERNKILKELNAMNINNATLFPGLQGFTESLSTQLAYPEKFGSHKE